MSSVDNNNQFKFSLIGIKETGFSLRPDLRDSDAESINWLIGYRPILRDDIISVEVRSVAIMAETNVEVASCSVLMSFKVENLNVFISKESDARIRVNDQLMLNMLNPAIGTLRGTMHIRFMGTPLERKPLPLINVRDMVKNVKNR